MRVVVLGAGGWGTAFARLTANAGHETALWARDAALAARLASARENAKYLPGVSLPEDRLRITNDLSVAVGAEAIFLAVPSVGMRDTLTQLADAGFRDGVIVSLAKGLDRLSRQTMSELIHDRFADARVFALSGPSHAEEVGRDFPTAVVLAGRDLVLGKTLQAALATDRFRVYLSDDLRGVELCAAVKNVIAVASGVCDGLGYGDNSRGALIARGLAEMVRFGRALGVREATFFGLSGLGDLVATCTSEHSRNRRVGVLLGRGGRLEDVLAGMSMVAEGVFATRVVRDVAAEKGIEMPITEAVDRLLRGEADAPTLVREIMTREPKIEAI
ncbi:MAG: NAD(P)H-dependent glycerol-3-phosphate dehydrogenase [Candidatus Bipolaricaulota bacterium]